MEKPPFQDDSIDNDQTLTQDDMRERAVSDYGEGRNFPDIARDIVATGNMIKEAVKKAEKFGGSDPSDRAYLLSLERRLVELNKESEDLESEKSKKKAA